MSFILQNIGLAIYGPSFHTIPDVIPRTDAIEIGGVAIQWNKLAVFAVVIPLLLVLTWFVRSTRQGKSMRAVAQDTDAAAMLGIDVNRTISVTFMPCGALAAAAGLIYLLQFNMRYDTGFELGLIAFTAGGARRHRNLPGAVLGAMVIGLIQAYNEGLDGAPGGDWTRTIVFGILIATLVFRPEVSSGSGRRRAHELSPQSLDPRRMEHGRVAAIALVTVGILYPFLREYLVDIPLIGDFVPGIRSMVYILVVTMMALGLNIVVGYAGLLDLGYVAFYAAGAYTAGWLASQQFNDLNFHLFSTAREGLPGIHISMWVVLIAAGVFTTVVGILIGLPTPSAARGLPRDRDARLRGDHPPGRAERRRAGLRLQRDQRRQRDQPDRHARVPRLGVRLGLLLLDRDRARSVHGLLLRPAAGLSARPSLDRDSRGRDRGRGNGSPTHAYEDLVVRDGAFFGGIAGAFYASFKLGANPSDFYFNFSIFLLCMVILGGIGSIWGVVTAGLILGYLNIEGLANIGAKIQDAGLDFDPTQYQFGIYGVIIVAMMLLPPDGLIPERRHKIELEEGVHDTPFYDVQTEGALTDRDRTDD